LTASDGFGAGDIRVRVGITGVESIGGWGLRPEVLDDDVCFLNQFFDNLHPLNEKNISRFQVVIPQMKIMRRGKES